MYLLFLFYPSLQLSACLHTWAYASPLPTLPTSNQIGDRLGGIAQLIKFLPNMHKALRRSTLSIT